MRRAVIVGLFVGLALTAWWGMRAGGSPAPATTPVADDGVAATTPPAVDVAPAGADAGPAPQRVEATEGPSPRADGASLTVSVVRAATGAPLPGAEVWFLDEQPGVTDAEQRRLRLQHRAAFDVVLRRYGVRRSADAQGIVRLPMPPLDLRIACSHDGLYGQLVINASEARRHPDGWRLGLETDCSVAVEVVDFGDRPVAGVPLALYVPRTDRFSATTRIVPMELGVTDADGRYQLQHAQSYRSYWGRLTPDAPGEVVLAVHVPGIRDVFARIVCEHPPIAPIRLRIPPTGRMRVEARDQQGRPVLHGISVQVTTQAVPDMSVASGMIGQWGWWQTSAEARVVFEHVAVGAELTVQSRVQARTLERTLMGPLVAGSEVSCLLQLEDEGAMLVGRVVDEAGAALVDRKMTCYLARDGHRHVARMRTDAAGILRVGVPVELFDAPGSLSLRATLGRDAGLRMTRRLDIETLGEGEFDLGDVVCAPAPLLVTGRFVGEPDLERVQLRAERLQAPAGQAPMPDSDALSVLRTGAEFAVYGHADGDAVRLVVSSPEHLPVAPIGFSPGARGVEIQLQRGGWAAAVVVHGAAISATQLLVRLVPHGAAPELRRQVSRYAGSSRAIVDGRTRFSWQGLPAGLYDLSVCTAVDQAPVFEALNVSVSAAAAVDDERITEIDLRDKLRAIDIRTVTGDGLTIADQSGSVFRRRRDGSLDPDSCTLLVGGRATILSGDPVFDLSVFVSQYRAAQLDNVAGDQIVTMVPGIPLRVTVSCGAHESPAGAKLLLMLEPVDPAIRVGTGSITSELQDGVCTMRAQVPGRYVANVLVTTPASSRNYTTEPPDIEVRDIAGEQAFRLRLK